MPFNTISQIMIQISNNICTYQYTLQDTLDLFHINPLGVDDGLIGWTTKPSH